MQEGPASGLPQSPRQQPLAQHLLEASSLLWSHWRQPLVPRNAPVAKSDVSCPKTQCLSPQNQSGFATGVSPSTHPAWEVRGAHHSPREPTPGAAKPTRVQLLPPSSSCGSIRITSG